MFKQAQIKLTIFYSVLFLLLFWLFSFGIYLWMESSFGEGYISQVIHRQQAGQNVGEFDNTKTAIVTVAGDVALDQLKNILLTFNGGLLIIIAIIAWFWAKRTLLPVQKMYEQQKQFISDASHEMRTPLSIMSGEIEVTLTKNRNIHEYKQTLTSNKEELNRLTSLVENLLFLAREDQSKKNVQMKRIDITDVVSNVLASFKSKITEKKLKIGLKPPGESITILGTDTTMYQLFANLIENAVKYTPNNGAVKIFISKKDERVVIQIKDTGIGINEKNQAKIFNRFYRVDASRSETKGYGLGLAICKAIVQYYKGKLTVHSVLGKGSTFTVELPLGL